MHRQLSKGQCFIAQTLDLACFTAATDKKILGPIFGSGNRVPALLPARGSPLPHPGSRPVLGEEESSPQDLSVTHPTPAALTTSSHPEVL